MTDNSDPSRLVSGRYVILALLAFGALGALGSWSYYAWLQRRPLDFWGAGAARLIAQAPRVEALRLQYAQPPIADAMGEQFVVGTQLLVVEEKREITRSPGLMHVRSALLNTASFGQTVDMVNDQPVWHYALRFSDGQQTATVVFSQDGKWAASSTGTFSVSLAHVDAELASFLREQFPPEVARPASKER